MDGGSMKKLIKMLSKRLLVILFLIMCMFVITTGNKSTTRLAKNKNNVKSVQAVHIVNKYNSILEQQKPIKVKSITEAAKIAPKKSVSFTGSMTAYGPDCKGCNYRTSCPPRQNLKNGNVYFNDNNYGKVRILAADSRIPCGTIIKISNICITDNYVYGVVLDRGSAITGTKMDIMYESEKKASSFGFQHKIKYEIVRWGW